MLSIGCLEGPTKMRKILLFYKYVKIADTKAIREWQWELCSKLGLKGRILLASEGINGTLGGLDSATLEYIKEMNAHPLFGNIDFKESPGIEDDFPKLQVTIKKEIVKLGLDPDLVNAKDCGKHLTPKEAHELLSRKKENLVILDGRNNYESRIGAFVDAIKPDIEYFRDFPKYVQENIDMLKNKEVFMYCTGGIRCERASAYLKLQGVEQVYQLSGGIHKYVEEYPDGFFRGKNYVFDGRISTKVNDDVLTSCDVCNIACDEYTSCMNAKCNKQYISCTPCLATLQNTCSKECKDLVSQLKVPTRPFSRRDQTIVEK